MSVGKSSPAATNAEKEARVVRLLHVPTAVCLLAMMAGTVQAASIGTVKTVNGDARLQRVKADIPATIGLAIEKNDSIVTGKDGSVGITFVDETMITVGPDAHVVIDDYLYAPADGKFSFVTSLMQGTLFYVSGLIAKTSPEAVTLATPDGTVGVRGTRVAINVDPPRNWFGWLGFSSPKTEPPSRVLVPESAPRPAAAPVSPSRRSRTSW